jgi:hypothetical protein
MGMRSQKKDLCSIMGIDSQNRTKLFYFWETIPITDHFCSILGTIPIKEQKCSVIEKF